jgi:sterol desaturase/sphingolipid hydroxylase (fatty acid hydroxylase superfamily)
MNYIILSIPIFFILIGVELLVSRLRRSELYRFNDAVSNISCGIMQQIIGVLAKTVMIVGYIYLYDHFRFFNLPDTWWVYFLLFIGVDFFYYWFHRLSHEINLLWGAHIVHHQSEEYNLSVALRQSTFQGFFSIVFYLPLALIGFNPIAFVTINAFQTLYQFWIHTKTINKLHPVLEFVFCTPSHHRVHHGRNPQYIDKNHGGTLIVFDRMFGTFQPEEEEVVYGVTKPLESWNPVWANFDYYADMLRDLRKQMSWADRLKYIFATPGWMPAPLGGYKPVPEVTAETASKFDTGIPDALNYYVLIQYLFVLGMTTALLFSSAHPQMTPSIMLGGSAWIIVAIASLGAIFESHRWARIVEPLRLGVVIAVCVFLPVSLTAKLGIVLIATVSIIWFVFYPNEK